MAKEGEGGRETHNSADDDEKYTKMATEIVDTPLRMIEPPN